MAYENHGAGVFGTLYNAGVPGAGTNETQTATIASFTGGTFKLIFDGFRTPAITWSSDTATLLSRINAALDLLGNGGTSWIVATETSLSGGNGTVLLTFSGGDVAKKDVNLMTADVTLGTGTGRSISIAATTPGVTAFGRDVNPGTLVIDTSNKIEYIHTGTLGPQHLQKLGHRRRLLDMLPSKPRGDSVNGGRGRADFLGDASLNLTVSSPAANVADLVVSEPGFGVAFASGAAMRMEARARLVASRLPSLGAHISRVICDGSHEQVSGIDAEPIVAGVAAKHPGRKRLSMSEFPADLTSPAQFAVDAHSWITSGIRCEPAMPATIGLIYSTPEPFGPRRWVAF